MGGHNSKPNLDDFQIESELRGSGIIIPTLKPDKSHLQTANALQFQFKSSFLEKQISSAKIDANHDSLIDKNFLHISQFSEDHESSFMFENKGPDLWSTLPLFCSFRVIEFIIDDLDILVKVSRYWRYKIKKILLFKLIHIKNKFQLQYIDYFDEVKARLNLSVMKNAQKNSKHQIKLDLVLRGKLKDSLSSKAVLLNYKYMLANRRSSPLFANYLFDVIKKGRPKELWIFQEERRRAEGGHVFESIQAVPMHSGDLFEIYINIWSPEGLLCNTSLEWQPLKLQDFEQNGIFWSNGGAKEQRKCPIENTVGWDSLPNDPREIILPIDLLAPCFTRVDFAGAGLETIHVKGIYKAIEKGTQSLIKGFLKLRDQDEIDPTEIRFYIYGEKDRIIHTVERVGLVSSDNLELNFRLGDNLIFYRSQV